VWSTPLSYAVSWIQSITENALILFPEMCLTLNTSVKLDRYAHIFSILKKKTNKRKVLKKREKIALNERILEEIVRFAIRSRYLKISRQSGVVNFDLPDSFIPPPPISLSQGPLTSIITLYPNKMPEIIK